jgi:uncharacterized protein DUF6265
MQFFSKPLVAIIAALCLTPASAFADNYKLDDLSWLTGNWIDLRDQETPIEVQWNPAMGGAMIGSWRKVRGGTLVAYEILTMRDMNGEIIYRFDFYKKAGNEETFSVDSITRLKLVIAKENHAVFKIIGEENWMLTMQVEDGVLRGYMEDQNNPDAKRFYSYVATKQTP